MCAAKIFTVLPSLLCAAHSVLAVPPEQGSDKEIGAAKERNLTARRNGEQHLPASLKAGPASC